MKFSMSEAWRDATAMMSANREVLLIVAAIFFLLPSLVMAIAMPNLQETIMADYRSGRRVNLEVDLLARYLERLLLGDKAAEPAVSGISEAFLAEHGFLKG